jgi:cysteine desulfurase/selenocysteine lyase
MNDITPELIARIATRLYNELPGAGPVSPPDVAAAPLSAAEQLPPLPDVAPPALPDLPVNWQGIASPVISETRVSPAPDAAASQGDRSLDGLNGFVQRIRSTHLTPGECGWGSDPSQDELKRLFHAPGIESKGPRPLNVSAIRKEFPALQQEVHGRPLVWFDNAATTQKPQAVIDALSNFYARDNSNIHRGAHTLAARATDAFEGARQKVQAFLGAGSVREIVFVRGTTEGINLISQTYGRKFLQPGDEIVLSTLEHHANIVPWQMIAREKGAILRVIPVTDRGEIMLEEYQRLLNARTRIVALTHASNSLGTILPVAEMTQAAKRYGARVLIDGAQSVAHLPVNVQELNCDFFVFSGHKIFGPTGIGVVYAKEELLEIMPPWQGGGNMIKNVTFEETTFAEPPAKFEAGTPNVADAVGLGAALDYVNRLGLANIGKYEHELLVYATERLSAIPGLRLVGTAREKVGVLSFVLANRPTEEVGRLLDLEGIAVRAGHHCAQPSLRRFGLEATVRPSLAFYNTPEEVDRLAGALERLLRL